MRKMFYYEDDVVPTINDDLDEVDDINTRRIMVDVTLVLDVPENREPFEAADFWLTHNMTKMPKTLVDWYVSYAEDECPSY